MICHAEDVLRLAHPEDYDVVRAIITHPEVAPTFGYIRNTDDVLNNAAIFLFDGGLFAAEIKKDYAAKLHLAVLPSGRGRKAIDAFKALVRWFFTSTPCPRLFGWSSSTHRANLIFNRLVGFRPRSARNGMTLFMLTRKDWEQRQVA